MKQLIIKASLLAVTAMIWLPTIASAGPGFNTNVNDGGCDVPLDGGLSLLAAAGVGYVAKTMIGKKKKGQEK